MSVQPRSDLELIDHLDWEHTPPCEHSGHGTGNRHHDNGPAYVLVHVGCPHCPVNATIYICRRKWNDVISGHYVECGGCGNSIHSHSAYTPLGWVE